MKDEAKRLAAARAIVEQVLHENGNDPARTAAALDRLITERFDIALLFASVGHLVIEAALSPKH